MNVDLPAPLGPIKPTHSPALTSRSRPCNAAASPKCLVTPRARITWVFAIAVGWGEAGRMEETRLMAETAIEGDAGEPTQDGGCIRLMANGPLVKRGSLPIVR